MNFQPPVFISGPTIIPEELRRAPDVLVNEALEKIIARAAWGLK